MEDHLSHYGVKGMKWGIRKSYQRVGRKSANVGQKFYKTGGRVKEKIKQIAKSRKTKIILGVAGVAILTTVLVKSGGLSYVAKNAKRNKAIAEDFLKVSNVASKNSKDIINLTLKPNLSSKDLDKIDSIVDNMVTKGFETFNKNNYNMDDIDNMIDDTFFNLLSKNQTLAKEFSDVLKGG